MFEWSPSQVGAALGLEVPESLVCSSISTDTRSLNGGAVFVALRGESFDGHEFLVRARDAGASMAIVESGTPPVEGLHLVHVVAPGLAYGDLARYRRRRFDGPVIAITGSNGKTSTKEMVAAALGTRWRVHATRGNNNNAVGVPLTILTLPGDAEALVVEVGASQPGEIGRLREIVEPDISIITNVFLAHLKGFGSAENILAEKLELARGVRVALVGTEPDRLKERGANYAEEVRSVGLDRADVVPDEWEVVEGTAHVTFRGTGVAIPLPGRHQAQNAMFALALADRYGLDIPAVGVAIEKTVFPPGRMQLMKLGGLTILNDSYNSNPASLRAALATAKSLRAGRRVVLVLGSMLELGDESDAIHEELLDEALELKPDLLVVVGEFARAARAAALEGPFILAEDADEAGAQLKPCVAGEELVLLKGSRGVHLENVIKYLDTGAR